MVERKRFIFKDYPQTIGAIVEDPETGKWYRIVRFVEKWSYQDEIDHYVYEAVRDEEVAAMEEDYRRDEARRREFAKIWLEAVELPEVEGDYDLSTFRLVARDETPRGEVREMYYNDELDIYATRTMNTEGQEFVTFRGGEKKQDDEPDPMGTFALIFG